MNKKFFIFNLMLLYTFAAIQATDIFTKNGDKIITNKQFIQLGSNSNGPTSSPMDINTYKDYILNTPNKKYQYHVKLGGSSPNMPALYNKASDSTARPKQSFHPNTTGR